MNVVVTGGATIAPIDDVRLLTNVSSGRLRGGDHRGLPATRERASGTFTPRRPSCRSCGSPGSISTRPSPPAELERLAKLRERWLAVHAIASSSFPLQTGNVDRLCRDARARPRVTTRSTS